MRTWDVDMLTLSQHPTMHAVSVPHVTVGWLAHTGAAMHDDKPCNVREDAFHVTAAVHMTAILAEGFRADRRGVLGTGAYFDLGSETTGLAPARRHYLDQSLVVFRCAVALGRVLDLDDEETRARFRRFQRYLMQYLGREAVLRLGH